MEACWAHSSSLPKSAAHLRDNPEMLRKSMAGAMYRAVTLTKRVPCRASDPQPDGKIVYTAPEETHLRRSLKMVMPSAGEPQPDGETAYTAM